MEITEKKALMMEISIFDKLSSDDLDVVAERLEYAKISQGESLIREGSVGNAMFCLVAGRVEIRKESMDGKQALMTQFSRGSIIGEQALLEDEGRRSASAIAIVDCEFLKLSRENFEEMISGHPKIGVAILKGIGKMLAERLRNTSGRFADVL